MKSTPKTRLIAPRELVHTPKVFSYEELVDRSSALQIRQLPMLRLLHVIRDAAFWGKNVKPSIDSIIRWLVKVGARVVSIQGDGTSTLCRLFPSPAIIVSYSPQPLKADRHEPGYTKLRGWRCALKTQTPVPSTYNLRIPIGNCLVFQCTGTRKKFFRAKTPPEEAIGIGT
jgi:hypothetical protein